MAIHPASDEVTAAGEIVDDAVGATIGDADLGRDVAEADVGFVGDGQHDPGVVGEEAPSSHAHGIQRERRLAEDLTDRRTIGDMLGLLIGTGRATP
jgi:hypothetical protein